jgi:hypothetical protein
MATAAGEDRADFLARRVKGVRIAKGSAVRMAEGSQLNLTI